MRHEIYCTCGLWGGLSGPHTAWCKTGYYDDDAHTWTITLDKYERDNLLWLLRVALEHDGPFTLLNTGDWNGQIPPMLSYPEQQFPEAGSLNEITDHPNQSLASIKMSWRARDEQIMHNLTLEQLQELVMRKIMSK